MEPNTNRPSPIGRCREHIDRSILRFNISEVLFRGLEDEEEPDHPDGTATDDQVGGMNSANEQAKCSHRQCDREPIDERLRPGERVDVLVEMNGFFNDNPRLVFDTTPSIDIWWLNYNKPRYIW